MRTFLGPLAALALSACGPELSQLEQDLLDAQNAVRSSAPQAQPPLEPFSWSQSATAVAQAWATGCVFRHNDGRGELGENIYANAPPGSSSPEDVVNNWASEAAAYDYANDTCSGTCGHYTQLVWHSTRSVGCAKATCTGASSPFGTAGNWEFWVCDYDPPGNFIGQKPY